MHRLMYFSYTSRKFLRCFFKKKPTTDNTTTCMNIKIIMPNEKNQVQNTQYILYDSMYKELQKTQNLICSGC